jgi:hypothetical protein
MAQEGNESPDRDTFFDAIDREGMSKDVRSNGFGDPGLVGNLLDDPLNGTDAHVCVVVFGKVVLNQPPHPLGHGEDSSFGLFAVRPSFPVDDKPALLPLDIFFAEMGKLAYSEASVKEGPDDKFFLKGLTGIDETINFIVA